MSERTVWLAQQVAPLENVKFPLKVQLRWVEGEDAEEFADLLGLGGVLENPGGGSLRFVPSGHGHWVSLVKALAKQDGDRIHVRTGLGNTFVFKLVGKP